MDKTRNSSLKLNMILNAIKGMLSVIFPLISFPYVSKVLGVDNIGRYNFAQSVINYFVLIAGLGINSYAIREGAKLRHKIAEFSAFANKMFSLNIVSAVIAYVLLGIALLSIPKFQDYKALLLILSIQIALKPIGIEWLYSVFEDYFYITVRSIIFHIVSITLLFLFIHNSDDVNIYAMITVFSAVGSNVLNFIHAKKYCKIRIGKMTNLYPHLKPIFVLFAMQISTTIYISSDTTILGFLCEDSTVGVYSVSTKVYSIVKVILSSIVVVSIPRLSSFLGKGDRAAFYNVSKEIYGMLLSIVIPAMIGIIMLREQVVLIVSDSSYLRAVSSLSFLAVALIFCLGAYFWGQCILVPLGQENFVFKVTAFSAIVNIVLNLLFLPVWEEKAAAVTTLIAEAIAFILQWKRGRKEVAFKGILFLVFKIFCGCTGIVFIVFCFQPLKNSLWLFTFAVVIASIILYIIIELCLKNEYVLSALNALLQKIKPDVFKKGE